MIAQVLLASAMGEDEPSSSVVDNETMVLEQIKFASGVVTFILIAIGILGNVLSLVVLTRPNMKVRIVHTLKIQLSFSSSVALRIPRL